MVAPTLQLDVDLLGATEVRFHRTADGIGNVAIVSRQQVGAGRGFGPLRGYGCHTVAPALRLFGSRAKRLIDTGRNGTRLITLDDGTRRAFIEMHEAENQAEISPWQMGALVGKRYEVVTITKYDEFYANLMKEAVKFFKTRQSPISPEEQLLGVAVECAADDSASKGGAWVDLES